MINVPTDLMEKQSRWEEDRADSELEPAALFSISSTECSVPTIRMLFS